LLGKVDKLCKEVKIKLTIINTDGNMKTLKGHKDVAMIVE